MRDRSWLIPLTAIATIEFATQASAEAMVREQKIISGAGARAMVDACAAWAERNHVTVAMSVLDWGGNLIESHAMEGAAANAIDTALFWATSALFSMRTGLPTNIPPHATAEVGEINAAPAGLRCRYRIGSKNDRSGRLAPGD
jgi:uncharacterized protein GlcG (DUF336 family)